MRRCGLAFSTLLAGAAVVIAVACGGGSTGDGTPAASVPPANSSPAGGTTPADGSPTPDATEQALVTKLQALQNLTLAPADVPSAFAVRASQPASPGEVAAAQIGIPKLAGAFKSSDLAGAWATFYSREQPQSVLSSIVYMFGSPASATALVGTIAGLTDADYPAATSVERVQADKVVEVAQMMRYRVPGARILEYTWASGRLAGQVLLRYVGDVEAPDDVAQIVALARKQQEHMAAFAQ